MLKKGFVFLCLFCSIYGFSMVEKPDSLTVLGKTYQIPAFWQPRKLDPNLEANVKDLKPLPQVYTYKTRNIFVAKEAYGEFLEMAKEAAKDSVNFIIGSGFRSTAYQKVIIERYLKRGVRLESILVKIAPPGYSEHMMGTALDFVPSVDTFNRTDTYKWLELNARKYGFKQTYMSTDANNTLNEPWHWNFIPNLEIIEFEFYNLWNDMGCL